MPEGDIEGGAIHACLAARDDLECLHYCGANVTTDHA